MDYTHTHAGLTGDLAGHPKNSARGGAGELYGAPAVADPGHGGAVVAPALAAAPPPPPPAAPQGCDAGALNHVRGHNDVSLWLRETAAVSQSFIVPLLLVIILILMTTRPAPR